MISLVTKGKLVLDNKFLASAYWCVRKLSDSHAGYYDVIISGGGLIGGAMARAIESSSFFKDKRALLLEAQPPPVSNVKNFDPNRPYSNRVCAISPASKSLLEKLCVWDSIERKGSVKRMQIWDACSDAMITFDKDDSTENLCYIVENNSITSSINSLVHDSTGNLETKYNSRIKYCSLPRNYAREDANDPVPNVRVELEDGQIFKSALLIAADGARSFVAQQANIPKLSWTYGQSAVVATLKLTESTENIEAWQRFLPTGPIAMLPLDDQHSSLVWSTSHDHADDLLSMNDEEFVAQINDAFLKGYQRHEVVNRTSDIFNTLLKGYDDDHRTDSMQLPPAVSTIKGDRAKFPLGITHCNEYVKPRLALIGDAAHRVHPLAGQGANLGFGDVSCLLKLLEKAAYEGKDLGCMSHLTKYESERQLRNASVMAVIDALNKLYSTDSTPIVVLRSLGLMAINASESFKKEIMKQAMA